MLDAEALKIGAGEDQGGLGVLLDPLDEVDGGGGGGADGGCHGGGGGDESGLGVVIGGGDVAERVRVLEGAGVGGEERALEFRRGVELVREDRRRVGIGEEMV